MAKHTDTQPTETFTPRNSREKLFVDTLANLSSKEDIAAFLRDLLTLPEIEEFANRIAIAKMLLEGHSYLKIAGEIGTSTTTVTRVAHWLYRGCGGYMKALKK